MGFEGIGKLVNNENLYKKYGIPGNEILCTSGP